ncbi:MAG: DUF421 domain-containing protein [Hyphomicrobiales bacterium]|nr:DUF421 domain-containing protein [Hyphomicrobiales bacterium]
MLDSSVINTDLGDLAIIVLRTLVVYVVLLFGLRIAGKRELGQMSPFDLVVILIIANAVQNAMVGADTSLNGGLLAALALLCANWLVSRLGLRFGWLERRVRGMPTLLINDGQFIDEHLRHEGLSRDDVMMAMREHGVDGPAQVKAAILEVDGTISIVARDTPLRRTRHRLRGRKRSG